MLPTQNYYKNTYISGRITKQNNFSIIIYVITILGEQSTTKCTKMTNVHNLYANRLSGIGKMSCNKDISDTWIFNLFHCPTPL